MQLGISLRNAIEMHTTLIDGYAKVKLGCLANFCDLGDFRIAKGDQ